MKYVTFVTLLIILGLAKAEDLNTQCTGDPKECSKKHTSDESEDEHGHSDESEHEAESSSQIGPDKGILEANENAGFKLSPEAISNFKLKFQLYSGGPVSLHPDSVLQTTAEKNIYRIRRGMIKRIDILVISKSRTEIKFTSPDLAAGDQIVVSGIGFLRMAELAAFGGAPEGHSH